MDMELSIEMNEEELEKIRKILTDGGLRHYILETSDNVKFDVVEFREYEKIEKENQKYKEAINKAIEYLENKKIREKAVVDVDVLEGILKEVE